jgi:hypothetical protein
MPVLPAVLGLFPEAPGVPAVLGLPAVIGVYMLSFGGSLEHAVAK